jgi:hypothetical protein
VRKDRISDFISSTGVKMVMGFNKTVDWLDSAVMDLLILDWFQSDKDIRKFGTSSKGTIAV